MEIKNWKMDIGEHKGLECVSPCDMYSVLENHGIIPDPYYGTNEKNLLSYSKMDCVFYSDFCLNQDELNRDKIELCFFGLDTICDIYFNGSLLGSVINMHRMYEYDVKSLARCENQIRLEFKSPALYYEAMEKSHHLYTNSDSLPGAAHLRKALYMAGWDWAPTLPNMGIFRDVKINAYDVDKIDDALITQEHKNGEVILSISVKTKHNDDNLTAIAEVDGQRIALENAQGKITVKNPRIWWPNGYGEQNLYNVTIYLYKDEVLIDTVTKTVGLRTIELCRDKDEGGEEFCFKVNGVKIFAMGANFVPIDSLYSRFSNDRLEKIIKDCIFANFNCIRVWGGAFYPDDYFYDLCDKYGLIIWQDFMVACANVWMRPEFEKEFEAEAIYNVKRIRHHASLGILCGNNEMEEAICGWECADGHDPLVRSDYLKLYEKLLPSICKEHAPFIPYTPSSPTSGGNFDLPQDFTRGDVHFWHVWNGGCGFEEYRKHKFRFCSEYGFESLPSVKTVYSFCPPSERNMLSYTMENHQKHWHGNEKILRFIAEHYRVPSTIEESVYASQLNQATAMKFGVEHFRRNRGYTMGSIYWQLNDCWPVASWSSIDYFGRYKALHYFARRFYAPTLVGLFLENGECTINIANEKMSEFNGYVIAGIIKNDRTCVQKERYDVKIDALTSRDIVTLSLKAYQNSREDAFFAELYDENGVLLATTSELFCEPKHFNFLEPKITVSAKKENDTVYLELASDVYARAVEISFNSYDLHLSDNYFDLFSDTPRTVSIKTELSCEQLLDDISLMSVYNIGR